jgi:allantoinase
MINVAIQGDRIITPTGIRKGIILIKEGIIDDIVNEVPSDITVIDAGNNLVMPGVVDPHVHINEPGRTAWEGFDTATKAALAGGVTTLVDMPLNSSPVTTNVQAFEQKLKAATSKIHVNCGFWGGIIPGNEKDIEPLIERGVLGFKAFLTHSSIDEFPNVTENDLRLAMPLIAKHNLPLLVHCELESKVILQPDKRSYSEYVLSRPKKWENDAIALMIRLCEEYNCRVHIVHLSSAEAIEPIKKAKEKGLPLTVETAQHYLFFSEEEIPNGSTVHKCAPPIRDKHNNDLLWQALKEGVIDFVATDHSPAPPSLKEIETGDFTKAWGGISSIQFALPALWTAARKNNCTTEQIAKWLCDHPARLIQKQKGRIERGYEADLIIWNENKKFIVTESMVHHRHKLTPYMEHELAGIVEQTWLGGELIFNKGQMKLGHGKILLA